MIHDAKKQAEIAKNLATARQLTEREVRGREYMDPATGSQILATAPPPRELFNLALVLAYCALDEALDEMRFQSPPMFNYTGRALGPKMEAFHQQRSNQWRDYDAVNDGRVARNDLAHRAIYATKDDCLLYIDAIRNEFTGWAIV